MPNKATDNQRIQFTPPSAATHIETPTSPGDGTVSDQIKEIIRTYGRSFPPEFTLEEATQQIQNLITKSRIDEAYYILEECAYKYKYSNRMISPTLIKDRIKDLRSSNGRNR